MSKSKQLYPCVFHNVSIYNRSVTKRVWSPPQRPFRVCCHSRETRKGITAGTLEELKHKVRVTEKLQTLWGVSQMFGLGSLVGLLLGQTDKTFIEHCVLLILFNTGVSISL